MHVQVWEVCQQQHGLKIKIFIIDCLLTKTRIEQYHIRVLLRDYLQRRCI